jgi:hypothetical protein
MDSAMIGKIQKARMYSQEPERVQFEEFRATFRGTNCDHTVMFSRGAWHCTCRFFATRGVCSHTMAMERLLGVMVPTAAPVEAVPVIA